MSLLPRLEPLQRRRRCIRFAATLAWLAVAVSVSLPILFATHLLLSDDVPFLRAALAVVVVGLVAGTTLAVFRGLRRDSVHSLAIAVEQRWPELGERVVTAVDAEAGGAWHGDPTWGEAIRLEAAHLLEGKKVREACSLESTFRLGKWAGLALLLATAPILVSAEYGRFAMRLTLAWTDRVHGFDVEVFPGDAAVAKGESVVITAKLVADVDGSRLPERAELRIDGKPPLTLHADESGSFSHVAVASEADTQWRLRVGSRTVGPFRFRAIDPAKLVQTRVELRTPAYASALHPSQILENPSTFAALQYSEVAWSFRLDRPAHSVRVHHVVGGVTQTTPLPVIDDVWTWRTVADRLGQHEAILETKVEEGVTWRTPLASWSVWSDHPPLIVEPLNDGSASAERVAAVGDRLRLKAIVEDAVGLEQVQLEWRVGNGPVGSMPLHAGKAKARVAADILFPLDGKAKEGDRIAFRLRAIDGRRLVKGEAGSALPPNDLVPQMIADPPDDEHGSRWLEYRIEPKAEPWHKKLILAQRDDIAQELDAIREKLEKERKDLQTVRPMFHQATGVTAEIARRLDALTALNREAATRLNRLGMKALGLSGLAPLGRLAQDVARRELGASEAALAKVSAKDAIAAMREREIDVADSEVRKAIDRLADLRKVNEVLAQARLEQEDLERLALREDAIANKAEDPLSKEDAAKLAEEQAKLAEDFEKLARESPQGKALAAKMQQAKAEQLAKQANDLAIRQRKLAEDRANAMQKKVRDLAAQFAERQDAIGKKSATSEKALRLIVPNVAVPTPEANAAGEHIREGKFAEALAAQKKVEAGLAKLAAALENDVDLATNPREKAKRLAERQQKLIDGLEQLGNDLPKLQPKQIAEKLKQLTTAQREIVEATSKLDAPDNARATAKQAMDHGTEAARQLAAKQALEAHGSMESARDALRQLAATLPPSAPRNAEKESADQKKLRGESGNLAALAKEQRRLHDDIVKALAEAAKEGGGAGEGLAKDAEKLSKQLMEFAQQADGPEAKKLGQEAAMDADAAGKSAAASKKEAEQGAVGESKTAAEEAAMKFEMAGKKADEAAAMSAKASPEPDGAAQALAESQAKIQAAVGKPDPNRLKAAAQSLRQAAKVMGDQTARKYPPPGPNTNVNVPDLPEAWKEFAGRSWGELPGEVRARVVEDLRGRYGEEYGPIIQRYFRNLAESSAPERK